MKKILYLSIMASALLFTGCAGEEDDLFEASAAERLNQASDKYSALLQSQEGGWVMQYYPTNDMAPTTGVGYLWCVKFNKDKSVKVGMNNLFSGNVYREETSGWDVITDNGPVLSFSTANRLVHAFSDPDVHSLPGSSDDVWGVGVGGDYEFVIVDAPEDHSYVMLKGKKRATYNLMTPLPAGTDFQQYLTDVDSVQQMLLPGTAPNNLLLNFGGHGYVVTGVAGGFMTFYPEGGDAITETEEYPYLLYKNGNDYFLRFPKNIVPNELAENDGIQQLKWDPQSDRFIDPTNESKWMESQYTAEGFFKELFEGGHVFKVMRNAPATEMSEKVQTAISAAHTGIKGVNKSYFIDEFSLRYDAENGARWSYKYQQGKAAKDIDYIYSYTLDGNKITFSYQKADQQNGEAIKNRVDAIGYMLENILAGEFTISKLYSDFNLRKIKLTSNSDADIWFVINY